MFDLESLIKYILEGTAVALAVWLIPAKKIPPSEIVIIALTAAAVFAVLDQFSPQVAIGARQGSGFSLGYQQVGLGDDPTVESNGIEFASNQPKGNNICQMNDDGNCVYSSSSTPEDQAQFTCKDVDGQCVHEHIVEGFNGF